MKIYVDDPAVPYKDTKVNPLTTKQMIEGILARWGIRKAGWEWDLEADKCVLEFQYVEKVDGKDVAQWVRLEAPRIWSRPKKNSQAKPVGVESINWAVSLRVLYWWLKTHLEMTWLEQSDKTTMFLPFIESSEGKTLSQLLVPKITRQLLDQPKPEDLR